MSNVDALLFGTIMIISLGLALVLGIIFEKKKPRKSDFKAERKLIV